MKLFAKKNDDNGFGPPPKSSVLPVALVLVATIGGGYFAANYLGIFTPAPAPLPPPAVVQNGTSSHDDIMLDEPPPFPSAQDSAQNINPQDSAQNINPQDSAQNINPQDSAQNINPQDQVQGDTTQTGGDISDTTTMSAQDGQQLTPPMSDDLSTMPSDIAQAQPGVTPDIDASAVVPAKPPVQGDTAQANAPPAGDLPVPDVQQAPATAQNNAATGVDTAPTAGEMAIVQNADVLDQLSQNAASGKLKNDQDTQDLIASDKAVQDIVESQEAVVRPLPKEFVVVKKDADAGDMDSRLKAARSALTSGNNGAALQLFNDLRHEYPMDNRVLTGRAIALQKMGQGSEAISAYEEVLTNDPKNLEALTNMLGLLKGQNPKLAREKLEELRSAYPYSADITAQLGIACGQAGDYPSALKYLDMADAMKPGNDYVLYNRAVLYDKMGDRVTAADLYRRLLRHAAEGSMEMNLPIDQIRQRLATMN